MKDAVSLNSVPDPGEQKTKIVFMARKMMRRIQVKTENEVMAEYLKNVIRTDDPEEGKTLKGTFEFQSYLLNVRFKELTTEIIKLFRRNK